MGYPKNALINLNYFQNLCVHLKYDNIIYLFICHPSRPDGVLKGRGTGAMELVLLRGDEFDSGGREAMNKF